MGVKELVEVFAVQFGAATPRLNTSLRPGDADEAVLSACSTLVTTIELDDYNDSDDYDSDYGHFDNCNSRVVQFSHYSVKEFLTSERLAQSDKRRLSQYYISPERAHTILAQTCISTLLQPAIYVGDIIDSFPLAKYATLNWFHHAQCDGVASQIQDGMERLFDPDRNHFSMWISIHDIDDPWSLKLSRAKASPLYYAALCGIRSIVEHLVITRRQDPNQSRGGQGTPLHVAVVSGHPGIAEFLLEHSADVNSRNADMQTPLHEAVGSGNLDLVQLLIRHGADVNVLDCRRVSPLRKAIQSQKLDVVELLLKGGADMDTRNSYGQTLLHEAAGSSNLPVAQLLISHGADVNALDRARETALQKAMHIQNFDAMMELLLNSGADVDIVTHDPTLLHEAARSRNLRLAQLLVCHGADVNAVDDGGDSPLHMAVQFLHDEPRVEGGADANVMHDQPGDYAIAQFLLGHGAFVNVSGRQRRTPLHLASFKGSLSLSRLLIDNGADLDARDDEERTPFSIALEYGHRKLARFLSNDRTPEDDA
jgi:cytohesin